MGGVVVVIGGIVTVEVVVADVVGVVVTRGVVTVEVVVGGAVMVVPEFSVVSILIWSNPKILSLESLVVLMAHI